VLTVAVIFGLPFLRPTPELNQNGNPPSAEPAPDLVINVTTQDTLAEAQACMVEFAPSFPILLDETGDVTTRYGVRNIPTSVFVDRAGVVNHVQLGALNGSQLHKLGKDIF
jgi:hypothetical protein